MIINKNHKLHVKAQATLEIALSLICVFILLFGSLNVFLWIHKKLVHSQEDYKDTRIEAGDSQSGKQIDYTNKTRYPDLNILSETN